MKMTPSLLCFDIGGTDIKFGLVNADGQVRDAQSIPTQATLGADAMVARLLAIAEGYRDQVAGISVSTFGCVAPDSGQITGLADAVPGYAEMPLGARLQMAMGLPVAVENDVNCVALAEHWQGAAQGSRHFIALTIGTGIGGAIVVDGALYRGASFAAGEWGYLRVPGGIWESLASTRALVRRVCEQTGETLNGRDIFDRLAKDDAAIQAVFDAWLVDLATGIVNLVCVLNPDRIVIGGGIAERSDAFILPLQAAMLRIIHPDMASQVRLVAAQAGNHAGLLGAARNWLTRHVR
jgi:predicted NBD/HSP70 family sugar kinase